MQDFTAFLRKAKEIFNLLYYKKWFRFIFSLPGTILLLFFGFILTYSTVDNRPITFFEWLETELLLFIFIIIPIDFIYWRKKGKQKYEASLLKKINRLKTEVELLKTTRHNLLIENVSKVPNFERTVHENAEFDELNGYEFENFCAALLKKNHFTDIKVTSGSGDQGIDIIAFKDGIKYGIQCKCYSSDIGNKAVQEAYSGANYYNCHIGVVLTNRHFTKSAKELAAKNGILLWDRDKLIELRKNSCRPKRPTIDIERYAAMCNAYLEHQDDMEQYKNIN